MQFPIGYYDESSPRAGLRHEHDASSRDDVAADHTRAVLVPKQSPDATMLSLRSGVLAFCCCWHTVSRHERRRIPINGTSMAG